MDLAVPLFGDLRCRRLFGSGRARALIARSETIARATTRPGATRFGQMLRTPDDGGSSSPHAGAASSRDSTLGFLAASGNPLERVLCLGRPVASSQAPHNVTPGAGDLRRPNPSNPTRQRSSNEALFEQEGGGRRPRRRAHPRRVPARPSPTSSRQRLRVTGSASTGSVTGTDLAISSDQHQV